MFHPTQCLTMLSHLFCSSRSSQDSVLHKHSVMHRELINGPKWRASTRRGNRVNCLTEDSLIQSFLTLSSAWDSSEWPFNWINGLLNSRTDAEKHSTGWKDVAFYGIVQVGYSEDWSVLDSQTSIKYYSMILSCSRKKKIPVRSLLCQRKLQYIALLLCLFKKVTFLQHHFYN